MFLACCIIYCIGISWKVYNVCKGTYVEEEPVFLKYKWSAHKQNKQVNKQLNKQTNKNEERKKKKVLPKHCRTSPRNKRSCEFPRFFSNLMAIITFSTLTFYVWQTSQYTMDQFKKARNLVIIGKLSRQHTTAKSACAHARTMCNRVLTSQNFRLLFITTHVSFFLNWPSSALADINHIFSVNEWYTYFFFFAWKIYTNTKALYFLR